MNWIEKVKINFIKYNKENIKPHFFIGRPQMTSQTLLQGH